MSTRLGTSPQPFNLDVSQGFVPGNQLIDKFGRNANITGPNTTKQTICQGCAGLYPYSNTDDIVSVSSDSAGDDQNLVVEGLDINGELVTQEVELSGRTRVALATPLWRVFRAYQKDEAGAADFSGSIYVYSGTVNTGGVPSGASVEKARIDDGNNQTLMSLYTIPLGKVGFLYYGDVGMQHVSGAFTGDDYAEVHYRSRRVSSVFKTKKTVDVQTRGSSIFQEERRFPDIIPALTDIEITKVAASANIGLAASFDVLLVDESLIPPAMLAAIDQPYSNPIGG